MKFFLENKETVLESLSVNSHQGLNDEIAKSRLMKYGPNEITVHKKESLWEQLRQAVTEQMIVMLLIAACISIIVGEYEDGLGILVAVFLGIFIGIVTEGKSKKAAESLSKITDNISTRVLRNNKILNISKDSLVPGDIVTLEMGDMIPADGRIIENLDLKIREDMLTGESEEVNKKDTIVSMEKINLNGKEKLQDPPPSKQVNMLFAGTLIAYGKGKMVVTATGDNTQMGKIAENLTKKEIDTPLQVKLGNLGIRISRISTFVAAMLFLYMTGNMIINKELVINLSSMRGFLESIQPLNNVLIVCIALIVAAVPEGLPTMVNMTLAITMRKMAQINALVTKKEACETIGSISVICSDKTGTLTQNKMSVELIYLSGQIINKEDVSNGGYFIDNCLINSTGDIEKTNEGYTCLGSATECALLLLHKDIDYKEKREDTKIVYQELFTSDRKRMSTIIEKDDSYILLCKGAPEIILNLSSFEYRQGRTAKLIDSQKKNIISHIKKAQDKSMRTIGFTYKVIPKNADFKNTDSNEKDMIFVGFVGIKDPVRKGVKESIFKAKLAGIETKMLTGDNINTAKAVANELGMLNDDRKVVEASYIDQLSDEELENEIKNISVVARSKPDTKMRIVKSLQNINEVVAVTGDGINDAPALIKADVGVAMGISGTEVTKNAADIILVDDSFSTIIQAIKWGRGIYENFQRFIQFQITVNIVAFLIAIISQVGGYSMPFTTIQLLWVNIIMDGPPALALGLEPVRNTVLDKKPTKRNANIITKSMFTNMIINSIYITAVLYAQMRFNILGADSLNQSYLGHTEMQTVLFSLFAICSLMNALNCREFGNDSIGKYFFENKIALRVIGITITIQILLTEICKNFFSAVALPFLMWVKILAVALTVPVFNEIIKYFRRKGSF